MSKKFGGPVILLDRNDINTDEIIPAKYLTEISKKALASHLLEDLVLSGFNPSCEELQQAKVVITRANFGCGSSREHAVWAFEVNDINVVIASSFARIFRQNMFNCGILAVELSESKIEELFQFIERSEVPCGSIFYEDLNSFRILSKKENKHFEFKLNEYDRNLVAVGGWLAYADVNY